MILERVYSKIESRQLQAGKSVVLKSEVCYETNGNMVTHFISPVEYIIVTNKLGEIKLYDPNKNTVLSQQSNLYGSQTTQFFCFLSGKSNDLGLNEMGFIPFKTYAENGLIVSLWKRKTVDPKSPVQQIKIVHQNQHPIYIDYKGNDDRVIRKVFYYGYQQLDKFNFPTINTEIVYTSTTDSIITKTTYNEIRLNAEATSPYFGYKIPATAKKIE
jgi:hypothetical protein